MAGEIAFVWHLHQPPYEDPETQTFLLPWVRLHATRGYLDMAAIHLRFPEVRATVNFSPILLEQLEAYAEGRARDRYLELTARPAADLSEGERDFILQRFFAVSWERGIDPLPRYRALLEKRGRAVEGAEFVRAAKRFTPDELLDLQVLSQLAWMGFFAREESELVRALLQKGRDYTEEEKAELLREQARLVAMVLPLWREVAAGGSVELSASPYAHPILPLLCDTNVASVALPETPLPRRLRARDEAARQVRRGREVHARVFGRPPLGIWPSEGSVSDEALEVLWQEGARWAATDEEVLLRSLPPPVDPALVHRPWKVRAGPDEMHLLFRDRSLSDRIGFTYARAAAQDAVDDLLGEVSRIDSGFRHRALIPIILDGENPWEYYPDSGKAFLEELYGRLARREQEIGTMTVADTMAWDGAFGRLEHIHPGSWIEGSFRIWMGHAEDVAAWNLLKETKESVDRAEAEGGAAEDIELARRHLLRAEASDWFWWYGEDFATETRSDFDLLFRSYVQAAFGALGKEAPPMALRPLIPEGSGFGEAMVTKSPAGFVRPRIDGLLPSYWEWLGAGLYIPGHGQSMYRGAGPFARLYFGFDRHNLFLRLDPRSIAELPPFDALTVEIRGAERARGVEGDLRPSGIELRLEGEKVGEGKFDQILEMALSFEALDLWEGSRFGVAVRVFRDEQEVQRLPEEGYLSLETPGPHFEEALWKV